MTQLTPEQFDQAKLANALELAGLRSVAAPIVEKLREDTLPPPQLMGWNTGTPEAVVCSWVNMPPSFTFRMEP